MGGRGSPDWALAQRSSHSAGGHVGVEHLKGAERRDDTLGVAGPTPEHDRGCCLAAPARWRTPPAWFGANQTSRAPSSLVKHRVARRRLHDVMISAGHHEPAANAANCRMAPPHRLWPWPRASDLGASLSALAIAILGMFCLKYYARPPELTRTLTLLFLHRDRINWGLPGPGPEPCSFSTGLGLT